MNSMDDLDRLVEQAYQAVRRRQQRLIDLVTELWDQKYRHLYIQWLRTRKTRLERIEEDWVRFLG